jgi:uncharacterized protein (DUF433 family)
MIEGLMVDCWESRD